MFSDLLRIIFPSTCFHCGELLVGSEQHICTHCISAITWNNHAAQRNNITELRLASKMPIQAAASLMLFKKGNVVQSILHLIKYHGRTSMGLQFGRILGEELKSSNRFDDIDYIVPVPLHWWKKIRRGYNQSHIICQGISEVMEKPIVYNNLYRHKYTSTQTHKNKEERQANMQSVFSIHNTTQFEGKHILIVDDIITTGATLHGCYQAMAQIPNLKVSAAALAITAK